MRRTILSENQYDRDSSPPRSRTRRRVRSAPPSKSPINKQHAAQRAEQQRGFQSVSHVLWRRRPGAKPRNAARHVRSATSTCSCSACAPSPLGPSPSKVGTPRAAVKFPSEPPPVPPSPRSRPSVAHVPRLFVEPHDVRGSFQGWASTPPRISRRVPLSRASAPERLLHPSRISHGRHADVDDRLCAARPRRSSGPPPR